MAPPNRTPVVVLVGSMVATLGAVLYAHWSQMHDKQEMHKGVLRDKERQRQKQQS